MQHAEIDLILMTLVIFVPVAFAVPLCLRWIFPRGSEEWMRWWTLLGTGVTLALSLCMFIDYYRMLNEHPALGTRPMASPENLLSTRADNALAASLANAPRDSYNWVARLPWIERFKIDYYLGVDGISMPLVLLTTLLSFLAMLASWNIEKHVRGYCALFLLLETGMIGTFLSLDFFLFYIFWEVMLLPMYFLIGIWGGPRREYAAIKFFLFTLLGSVFILIALLGFYFTDISDVVAQPTVVQKAVDKLRPPPQPGEDSKPIPFDEKAAEKRVRDQITAKYKNSFDLIALQRAGEEASRVIKQTDALEKALEQANASANPDAVKRAEAALTEAKAKHGGQQFYTRGFQIVMFVLLLVGFAIKVPVFPFHTWLPDAHVEAPTPISMILAGVLLKMGGYGILRIAYPICPWAAEYLALMVAWFGIINIVYGAFAAMAQTDFKKLVAYSSISHMGYVILGIAVWSAPEKAQYWDWGMTGAMFQMIAHGITSAGMFFLVGVIYDRAHHRNLDNFRGLNEPMPVYGGISAIIFFAAMGLPGMCGFVGEFMVVLSTWNFSPAGFPNLGKVFAILAALTVVLTAGYILWTIQRVFLGHNPAFKDYPDIKFFPEQICILPLVVLAILLGVFPEQLLLSWMEPSLSGLVETLARLGS